MAKLNYPSPVELRPCYVDGKKALFHLWADKIDFVLAMQYRHTVGIVEFEDGSIKEVEPRRIRFVSTNFNAYCFFEDLHIETNVNLPVKPGDTVWMIIPSDKTIICDKITEIRLYENATNLFFKNGNCYSVWNNKWSEHIGVFIFLTREEAEKTLKESEKP